MPKNPLQSWWKSALIFLFTSLRRKNMVVCILYCMCNCFKIKCVVCNTKSKLWAGLCAAAIYQVISGKDGQFWPFLPIPGLWSVYFQVLVKNYHKDMSKSPKSSKMHHHGGVWSLKAEILWSLYLPCYKYVSNFCYLCSHTKQCCLFLLDSNAPPLALSNISVEVLQEKFSSHWKQFVVWFLINFFVCFMVPNLPISQTQDTWNTRFVLAWHF